MPSLMTRLGHTVRVGLKRFAYEGVRRDAWQHPDRVVDALGLRPGMRVADVGAGLGYFAFRFADAVGRSGVVYAVDTDTDLRVAVAERARREDRANVHPVAVAPHDLGLPEQVDLVFAASVFHHLPDPASYFERGRRFLRPGGRVAILEVRSKGARRSVGQATDAEDIREQLEAAGYRCVAVHEFIARESFQVFEPVEGAEPEPDRTTG